MEEEPTPFESVFDLPEMFGEIVSHLDWASRCSLSLVDGAFFDDVHLWVGKKLSRRNKFRDPLVIQFQALKHGWLDLSLHLATEYGVTLNWFNINDPHRHKIDQHLACIFGRT